MDGCRVDISNWMGTKIKLKKNYNYFRHYSRARFVFFSQVVKYVMAEVVRKDLTFLLSTWY